MEKLGLKVSIVSIQADQSRHRNKDGSLKLICDGVSIVSIQADQSRPTYDPYLDRNVDDVSIVSIQADQSRLGDSIMAKKIYVRAFQSYQFRQINPDFGLSSKGLKRF